jgi:hypothetical protein
MTDASSSANGNAAEVTNKRAPARAPTNMHKGMNQNRRSVAPKGPAVKILVTVEPLHGSSTGITAVRIPLTIAISCVASIGKPTAHCALHQAGECQHQRNPQHQ